MLINRINPRAMRYLRACELCRGHVPKALPECPKCSGAGVLQHAPDSDQVAYLARAESLHDFLGRLVDTLDRLWQMEGRLLAAGEIELACVVSGRRSGMAEVATALHLWLTVSAAAPPGKEWK
jgi:hypothetical protein